MDMKTLKEPKKSFHDLRAESQVDCTPEIMIRRLHKVVLTGLNNDQMRLLAMVLFSALVEPRGTIGAELGPRGERYSHLSCKAASSLPFEDRISLLLVSEDPDIE